VLAGRGYGLDAARPAVELVHALRSLPITERPDLAHPALSKARPAASNTASWMPPKG
jgi:hypothetical protein